MVFAFSETFPSGDVMNFDRRFYFYVIAFIGITWYRCAAFVAQVREDALTDPSAVAILSFKPYIYAIIAAVVMLYVLGFAAIVEFFIWAFRDDTPTPKE